MNCMNPLIKKIAQSKLAIFFRNLTGIRPVGINTLHIENNCSLSDAFFWRTSENFITKFKFSDLLKIFFQQNNTEIQILFYNKNNKLVKDYNIKNLDISNEIIIDPKFLGGIKDYGVFYIFHKTKQNLTNSIRNSCYLGYSINNSIFSFVHGNIPVAYKQFNGSRVLNNIVSKSLFKNQVYKIQNYFSDFTKSEIFLNNPTNRKILFSINKSDFSLNANCSKIVNVSGLEEINIISNCYFLRPIVINYKNNFFDIYHG